MTGHRAIVDDIQVTLQNQIEYSEMTSRPELQEEMAVTLTAAEWGAVFAALRGAMVFSSTLQGGSKAGIIRILHDRIYEQLPMGLVTEADIV